MRVAFLLDDDNVVECRWSALSGREQYLHNGRIILSMRSFSVTGVRELNLEIAGQPRKVTIELHFQPSIKSVVRNNGYVVTAHVDGKLYVENLLDPEYRVTTPGGRVFKSIFGFILGALLLFGVDAYFFNGALLDLPSPPMSDKLNLINAALGVQACHDSLDDHDSMLVVPLRRAAHLRRQELKRTAGWRLEQGETRLSALGAVHWGVNPVCRASVRELIKAYLRNGAMVDERSGSYQMTPLESAIMGGDDEMACLLLQHGASLEEKVVAKRRDGSDTAITGMDLYELAQYQAMEHDSPENIRMLMLVERFISDGQCSAVK